MLSVETLSHVFQILPVTDMFCCMILPKAAETLKYQTQDQLKDNITSLMGQDPSQKSKESAAVSRRSSHGLDLKYLDKLTRNIGKFNPSKPNYVQGFLYLSHKKLYRV